MTTLWNRFSRHLILSLGFVLSVSPLIGEEEQSNALERFEYSTVAMGSGLDFILYAESPDVAAAAISDAMLSLEVHSGPINNYAPESEVNKLKLASSGVKVELSQELYDCLKASKKWFEISEGAFDSTQNQLFQVWLKARKTQVMPSESDVQLALRRVEWSEIAVEEFDSERTLKYEGPRLSVDVGGLAVGYLIDQMMNALKHAGIESAMIDAGGDIIVSSAPPNSGGWRIDVAGLHADSPPICRLQLEDCSITTSGDLNQFGLIDGVRYSHIVDPRTAKPVTQRRSVTVIAKKGMDADAGATALAALGPEDAFRLVGAMPIQEVFYLTVDGEELTPKVQHWEK